jgi:hypothetical protein
LDAGRGRRSILFLSGVFARDFICIRLRRWVLVRTPQRRLRICSVINNDDNNSQSRYEMQGRCLYNGQVPADLSIMDTRISDRYISTIAAPLILTVGLGKKPF